MKRLLLALLAFAAPVHAQEYQCPKFYPWQDTVLAEVPYEHRGKGLVRKRELSGAGAFWGDFNGMMQIVPAEVKKVRGGTDLAFPPDTRWLVCSYGDDIAWWEELRRDPKARDCTMQVRNKVGRDPMDIRFSCR